MPDSHAQTKALLEVMNQVQRALRDRLEQVAATLGLTLAQVSILFDLTDHPDSSLQDVCLRLNQPKSSVSRLVDELVHLNLVERQIPADNRRSVLLNLVRDAQGGCPADSVSSRLDPRLFPEHTPEDEAEITRLLGQLRQKLLP